jgi:hypothetical protein
VPDTEPGERVKRVRQAAKGNKKLRFTALPHQVNIERLRSSYCDLQRQAAAGADGVTRQEYGNGLEERLPARGRGRAQAEAYATWRMNQPAIDFL